jgi:hypothetical protein
MWMRIKYALAVLFGADLATLAKNALPAQTAENPEVSLPKPATAAVPDASTVLFLLNVFQREGRLIDFLQEDIVAFSDADVGAAARAVHAGCRKVLRQWFAISPVLRAGEGEQQTMSRAEAGGAVVFTGNVKVGDSVSGIVKHRGWRVDASTIPSLPQGVDSKVLASAEVEVP